MTDIEIIDRIKMDIIRGNTADFLTLDIFDENTKKRYCFGDDLDDMMQILFDYSLVNTIVGMTAIRPMVPGGSKSYNGDPYPIVGYIFAIGNSTDNQTNISPMLMKFLEVVMNRVMLDRLAFPMMRSRIGYEEITNSFTGVPIISPPYEEDPWKALDDYLAEGVEASDG